jgi:hypothetical protein
MVDPAAVPSRNASLEPLLAAVSAFVRDPSCRLLNVIVDPEVRGSIVGLIVAHEHRPDNAAPFVALEHGHTAECRGWRARAAFARQVHLARRQGAEDSVPPLPEAPDGDDEQVAFAQQLQQLLDASPRDAEGLVVVLGPSELTAPARFREAVDRLIRAPMLAPVRWIVVAADEGAMAPCVAGLGPRARQVDARASNGTRDAELDALAAGRRGARPRGVTPPPRADVPDRVPGPEGEQRLEIGRLSLAAALAAARGHGAEAVASQRRARDLARSLGWTQDAVVLELALAGHLVAAGAPHEAETVFLGAIDSANAHDRPDQATTAGFGLAATRMLRAERHTALVAYADAALAAERSGSDVLAVEGSRLAGDVALGLRMEPQAITFLARAVTLADASSQPSARRSGSIAASALADLCARRGSGGRAADLRRAAARLDGESPGEPVSDVTAAPELSPPTVASPRVPDPPPAPAAFDEGTGLLTLEQIAQFAFGGIAADATPPHEGSRSWTAREIESLQRAVDHSLGDEATTILSADELAALRGESVASGPADGEHGEHG